MFSAVVEEFDLTDRSDGGDLINDFKSPPFGKVRDVVDELGYGVLDFLFRVFN